MVASDFLKGPGSNFPTGINTGRSDRMEGKMRFPDPTRWLIFDEDFMEYAAADWTITTVEAGSGSATEALVNESGGVLLLTNDDADNDSDFLQWPSETFLFAGGKETVFRSRLKISDAVQSDMIMGLQITDTAPLAVSDGVYFIKNDGAATLDFVVNKNGTLTTKTAVATLVNDTYVDIGFIYNGVDKILVFVDSAKIAEAVVTNLPDDEELTISFGIQNGEAVAKTMSIDYIFAVQERV